MKGRGNHAFAFSVDNKVAIYLDGIEIFTYGTFIKSKIMTVNLSYQDSVNLDVAAFVLLSFVTSVTGFRFLHPF